ncbi:hypothetical protein N473_19240 [Pseudoalteromonas luteoviolacea CPMOR-1]|uniref:DUF4879 domain-containing protein n=1 Tax=Pseudoalteromonas luteoviolacea CPMOR-1 TaxID=1365248 RepID=A0A167KAT3_9GAMM|nr:DUF4879 domain-containing protein [Pseudoalteromonas luteoviolacea]KZN62389.1 hypothetical protein N473_19240 [Pseudoalteromonas luteoviolacea CPMOR-1]
MYNFKKISLATTLFASTLIAGHANAANIERGIAVDVPEIDLQILDGEFLDKSQLQNFALSRESQSDISIQGPASGISYYEVFAVGSSNMGWEYPSSSDFSTTKDHGGNQLLVAVIQYGYGNPNKATMNGLQKSYSNSEYLCGSMSNLHICKTGETVTGFLYYFDFSGQQSGQFNTSSNSIASPFGHWSDSIYIK